MVMERLFRLMAEKKASDLFLSPGSPVHIKINGATLPVNQQRLEATNIEAMLREVITDRHWQDFLDRRELNIGYGLRGVGSFRINVFQQRGTPACVIRFIPGDIPGFEDLRLPPVLAELVLEKRGLLLVVGSTGSGKSTTLASMIDAVNTRKTCHIVTIEDPIEFVHGDRKCVISQREVGHDSTTFAQALRAALRQDPDIILVGEMRDLETISVALTAAETGHLVFATLHTQSAMKTIDRIIDVFPSNAQEQVRSTLADTLKGVLAQTLFKRIDTRGLAAAIEVLVGTAACANLIREAKTHQLTSVIQTGRKLGMQTLDEAIEALLVKRQISPEEAFEKSVQKERFVPYLKSIPVEYQDVLGKDAAQGATPGRAGEARR